MKEPLLDYINKNKDELDVYTPDQKNWLAIKERIDQKRTKRKRLAIGFSAAALILTFFIVKNTLFEEKNDDIAQVIADPDYAKTHADSTEIIEKNLVGNGRSSQQQNAQNHTYNYSNGPARGKTYNYEYEAKKYEGYRNVETGVSRTNYYDGTVYYSSDNQTRLETNANMGCDQIDISTGDLQTSYEYRTNISNGLADVDRNFNSGYYYEQYNEFVENEFENTMGQPVSTFGIDVDGASYSNVRRYLNDNFLPPKNAVKLEELINYFDYDLPEPKGPHPFSITTELGRCPWENENLLMQVAIKGRDIEMHNNYANNLVFLIDVSGSMSDHNKLPLLKKSLKLLVNEMSDKDRIAIVVYAGAAGLSLPSTSGKNKHLIRAAIDNLNAGGSTAGGEGINLAYKTAQESFLENGNNRIILATDGDFNVGISNDYELVELIERQRETGVFLSVLGFGTGNYQDGKMEKLADNGNGNHYYIDNLMEAKKVLVHEMRGTLITIAKDVKLQLEFNPEHVKSYRLLGYENRILAAKDFDDDTKDAGDLGSGHTIVALYEIIPQKQAVQPITGLLRYQKRMINGSITLKDELAMIKFRYKKPSSDKSQLMKKIVLMNLPQTNTNNFYFAAAVAEFGLLIRESKFKGGASFKQVIALAKQYKGIDTYGYRAEFIQLVRQAELLMKEYSDSRKYDVKF